MRRNWTRRWPTAAPTVLLMLLWMAASLMLGEYRLVGPVQALRLLYSTALGNELIEAQGGGSNGFAPHVWSTLWHVVIATSTGLTVGLLAALAITQHATLRDTAATFLEAGRTLPPLIFVPFATAAIGASDWVRFISIAFYSSLTIAVYAVAASIRVARQPLELATLLGASRLRRILTVQLPAIVPVLLGPIRLVCAFALGISIVVEYLVAPTGIGRVMKQVGAYSRPDLIIVGVIWTVILALLIDAALVLAFSSTLRWTTRNRLLEWMAR